MDRSPGNGAAPKHGTFSTWRADDVVAALADDNNNGEGAKAATDVAVAAKRMDDNVTRHFMVMVVVVVGKGTNGRRAEWSSSWSKDTATSTQS
jgi:stress response protein SCP2